MKALPVALLLLAAAQERRPDSVTASGDELKPGLAAVYRGSDGLTLYRIDSKPSFTWGDSSPHPRIPAGPFEATWTGVFAQPESDSIRFSAAAGGEVRVTLGGVVVLDGAEGAWRPWTPGLYRIEVKYRSLAGVPARLQLWWEGKGFSREPLPPWRLRHLPAELSPAARRDLAAEKGRREVERLGCANCHRSASPGIEARPPGPSLERLGVRVRREWLMRWLENPAKEHPGARMPALFTGDRQGFVERSTLADYLLRDAAEPAAVQGRAREGRTAFLGLGCAACHFVPDMDPEEQGVPGRTPLVGLRGRMDAASFAAFLENPLVRYPDGRMPRLPVTAAQARDIAAYLLPPGEAAKPAAEKPVTAEEAQAAAQARGVGVETLGRAVMAEKRCHLCHPGLAEAVPDDLPIKNRAGGCLSGKGPLRFAADASIAEYLAVAAGEKHASPFDARQRLLERSGCARCHARDTDRPPPIEEAGSLLGGAGEASLFRMPFQRTPRLTHAHARYRRDYLTASVRDGVSGVRPSWYSYRMPAYGKEADALVRALAEADGAQADEADPQPAISADPTLPGLGPQLVGFEGYSCISCHIWKGKNVAEIEHGSVGPELTGVTGRLRRDWFDRWLEDPARAHPGTPMPQVFRKGQPATVESILGGNSAQQKEAFWAYLALGKAAADPKSLPAVALEATEPLVALAPIHLPDRKVVEAVGILFPSHDFLLYDLAAGLPHGVYTGARLLRVPKDRRSFALEGTRAEIPFARAVLADARYVGFDRLADGIRVRWSSGPELLRLEGRVFVREVAGRTERFDLPPARALSRPPAGTRLTDPGKVELAGRPGYRLVPYPRPKTVLGEDAVMPGAIVASPKDGRVYVASMKMGDVLRIDDPKDDGREARFVNYAGLLQDAYSMVHDGESLYVLHRRNLTRVRDTDGDGRADAFDRVAALDHAMNENVDNAYGLVREPSGSFVFTHAANTPQKKPGWGSVLRLTPGPDERREELGFGMRRAYGWSLGPEDGIFFTDNQGEWVASSKLCRVDPGRYYGYPNPGQNHAGKPAGKTAVWIPYGWARSTNGLALDMTGGKFGPFAGQFFLAEMMYGGGVVRAQVEKVNGEWQGACFPFWDKGLVGPLVVAFDPRGRLWVGSITDASCGSQPDRGAVFRIDYTGELPFEIQSIHIRPRGFRLVFTRPADPRTLSDAASYLVEHYRYEYTGAYGSPELDRTRAPVERLEPSADGRSVDLSLAPLVRDRVYMLTAAGVRSSRGEPLVHPAGAYTVNEVPAR